MRGSRFLRVRFQPAYTADLNVATAPATYTGPHRFDPTTARTVRSVVLYDASEGVVGWIIGLDGSGRYTVTTTASPPSLTVRVSR